MLAVVPFLNNNSFLITAISQGYDNYGDSYSKYPTDDKKYECRTGPFEGFFVSSVKFCKFEFDDRKDNSRDNNQTGTQGPQGPTGATGPAGAEGPSGLSEINNTNLYLVIGNVDDINSYSSTALCEPGDFVVGGGFTKGGSPSARAQLIGDTSIPLADLSGWNATAFVDGLFLIGVSSLTAHAICFDNSPPH